MRELNDLKSINISALYNRNKRYLVKEKDFFYCVDHLKTII